MAFVEHLDAILGALGGGLVTQLANWGINRKKGKQEVNAMEIDNIKEIVDSVYQPLIDQQNKRIKELELEVRELREERVRLRDEHQKEIAKLQKQIIEITKALGMSATEHIRNSKGQFTKKDD
jgi:maltodextrin utilization protein YvdJ